MRPSRESASLVFLTITAALLLTLLPAPAVLEPFKPYWVALVIIYWSLETRGIISLGLAFLVGLVLDILSGSLMGLHALSLVIMAFLVQRFRSRLRFFPPWQQALSVLGLLVNDRIILIWIIALLGEQLPTWKYWLPPLVGMALWPWLFLLLDRMRARTRRQKS
ncbi:MAG: rod shape-determining protein MreD [Gammaproteobacteria bacterium]|nr:rod shape-determining protein MreD [Gammaproteobacteria bacterium]NNK99656.1 rod shape-determining protein MreD [Xanthomonadales bacterium]